MACAVFVIEYQHHKATADYMARANSGLKGKTAAGKTEAACTSLKGKQPPQAAHRRATTGQAPASSGAAEAWRAPSRACHKHLRNA